MIKKIRKIIKAALSKFSRSILLMKYDNFTIAEYFRQQGATIGEGCYIVPRSLGTEPYLVTIGNHVAITEGVRLHTHDGGTWIFRQEHPDLRVFGTITIEDNCLIGLGAQILPGVTIGKNSIVGAGSIVISDVPPNSIVMGIPARIFGSIAKYKEKCIEIWRQQKPPDSSDDFMKHYESLDSPEKVLNQLRKHLSKIYISKLNGQKIVSDDLER